MHYNEISLSQNDYQFLKKNVQYLEMATKDYLTLIPQGTVVKMHDIYVQYTGDSSLSTNCSKCLLRMVQSLAKMYEAKKEWYRTNDKRNTNK